MAEKIFTVDKFLGLNEAADGTTELKLGEASKIENFCITDGCNLKLRPGISRYADFQGSAGSRAWTFYSGAYEYLAVVQGNDPQTLSIYRGNEEIYSRTERAFYNVFPLEGNICVLYWDIATPGDETGYPPHVRAFYLSFKNGGSQLDTVHLSIPYAPLYWVGGTPAGGGEESEPLNLLSRNFYAQYTADGVATEYVLPSAAADVLSIFGLGGTITPSKLGAYDRQTHTFTFQTAPEKDTEIDFFCETDDAELLDARNRLLSMPYTELFNGATDTRVFFYGDGTNICYYSRIAAGHRYCNDGFYIPAGNELAVDFSQSPITGMIRHYSRLLAFKPDGVDAITYEPITLADGTVTAGFFLQPVNRDYGNDSMGQVTLVNNYPRTFSGGDIYEWRIASSYRDERSAKLISQKISRTLSGADTAKLVACDHDAEKTYYVFLNDESGTVLVNRYDLDAWSIYRSALTKNVLQAFSFEGKLVFLRADGLYFFDESAPYDASEDAAVNVPIQAVWESGYMAFGADYKRKYSSNIWVSLLPGENSKMKVTVKTDRREDYMEKNVGFSLFDLSSIDFFNFSFITRIAPQIKRIKLKVKKFVYYKLIFRIDTPGARATVLGYDQQIRYSSNVK